MNYLYAGVVCLGLLACLPARAQDPDSDSGIDQELMTETALAEEESETLLLDNSRSKIGRDFYDAFFRQFAALPKAPPALLLPTDTTARTRPPGTPAVRQSERAKPTTEQDINAFVVTIDELPAPGIGTALLSVTLNDQVIWQNYVQLRQELIEAYALNAAETLQQYILNYKDVQQQLGSEDQQGTGLY